MSSLSPQTLFASLGELAASKVIEAAVASDPSAVAHFDPANPAAFQSLFPTAAVGAVDNTLKPTFS